MITSSYISAFVQAMGWVLLHSLWQITLVLIAECTIHRFSTPYYKKLRACSVNTSLVRFHLHANEIPRYL